MLADRSVVPPGRPCLCGRALDSANVVCAQCHALIVSVVSGWFGPHRYGGRYADLISDVVNQYCYEKQLLRPGVLESFRAPPEPEQREPAFRGWLRGVVRNACRNALRDLRASERPSFAPGCWSTAGGDPLAHMFLKIVFERACSEARRAWTRRGWRVRFEIVERWHFTQKWDYAALARSLEPEVSGVDHARSVVCLWRGAVWDAMLVQMADTLDLGPNPDRAMVDREARRELNKLLDELSVRLEPKAPRAHELDDSAPCVTERAKEELVRQRDDSTLRGDPWHH